MWQKCSVLPYDRFEKDYGRQLPVHFEAVVTLENVKCWGQILNFEWNRDVLGGQELSIAIWWFGRVL